MNKMKKVSLYVMICMLSFGVLSTVHAADKKPAPEPKVMLNRLEEIKEMDRSDLDRFERKALRKEVRAIKTQLRTTGNGIYISAGALIIILLLIIIL